MKILLAADGSEFTGKALAFLVAQDSPLAGSDEVVVINVQPPLSLRVRAMMGETEVAAYHKEETENVLEPIRKFLDSHAVKYSTKSAVGHIGAEILRAATETKAHMIAMGTHGHGLVGRMLMGSVAQQVVQGAQVPVLLVK